MEGPITPDSDDTLEAEYLEACTQLLATKVADELLAHPNSILPEKALLERYQQEMKDEFAAYGQRQKNGAQRLSDSLEELSKENPEIFTDEVLDAIDRIATLHEKVAQDKKAFSEHISNGGTIQEFANVDNTTMDCLYQGARRLYDLKQLEAAADAFLFLTGLNPDTHVFWLGLANSEFDRKNYKEALSNYEKVLEKNPFDPSYHLALCQCYELLGQKDKAINTIHLALETLKDQPEFEDWKQELEAELIRLQH